jgi:hypothetical protein
VFNDRGKRVFCAAIPSGVKKKEADWGRVVGIINKVIPQLYKPPICGRNCDDVHTLPYEFDMLIILV